MENQNINLYKETNKKTEVFLFHIQRKALNFFCCSINNKSFMLYLLCLELSNRKGFCRLNTKELAKTFKVTAKSICNWLKEIHNNNYITAYYNPHKHYWKVRVNTKRHYELWKKFDGEEMPNSQFSDDDINDILSVLDGKPKENNEMPNEKAPNVAKTTDSANANTKNDKNDSTDDLTAQGIFGLVENLIENPNALDDIADKRLNHNDNSSAKSESLEALHNENAENLENPNVSSDSGESNNDLDNEDAENSETKSSTANADEPQPQESQDNPNENSQSNSESATNSNENLSESQDGGNEMSAMNEMTEDEKEDFDLEETSRKAEAFMQRFNFGVNKTRSERDENQKVLIVTPYKTFIADSDSDIDNIAFTLEMIEQFEKNERERISYYVGQPISPIKKALRNAKARIRAKKVTTQDKINEIMQTTLNKIDFLKEIENEDIDSVSIWCVNYNNLKEIQTIQQKAESLNKQVNLNFMSYLNDSEEKLRLDQIRRDIDDPYFYMKRPKASDFFNEFADFDIKKPMQPAQNADNENKDAEIEKGVMNESNESVETPAEAEVS